ncbi:hypothetical protein [Salinarimonas ramus]|uniref:Uncharacterized protein n=1 Tax=Salinarimonas ramus TaxID=690164 RepID=A0A917QCV1_9HYPH|nr:hypothetical protein [Salinarimonas ramus]GGK43808.1 hypothetical protein GCM10011322_33570 [Salinarimonas ramus]
MTTRRVWIVAWAIVALWSLAALLGYGAVDLVGGFAVNRADLAARDPEQVAWIAWFFDTIRDLGLFAIVAIWLVVGAIVLGIAALVAKATGDRERFTDARR